MHTFCVGEDNCIDPSYVLGHDSISNCETIDVNAINPPGFTNQEVEPRLRTPPGTTKISKSFPGLTPLPMVELL